MPHLQTVDTPKGIHPTASSPAKTSGLPFLLLFAATLFLSATLLFLVQPMVGKMLLPLLGGTPAVWNTCMVFFQALLLAGYGYAHATTGLLGTRRQALLHLGVLVLPVLTLGLTIQRGLLDSGEGNPIPGLLLALVLSVGLPFFVVSTSAPLLQKWFADTGHPAAKDPYFLYGASNLGSMLALLGYPLVIEFSLQWGLPKQRLLWQIGYGVLAALTAACAFALRWSSRQSTSEEARRTPHLDLHAVRPAAADDAPTLAQRLYWIGLAFVPSSLMLGATTYMTTDIAAIPLLWVLPLGLYLLSFILVFSRLPGIVHRVMIVLLPMVVLALVVVMQADLPLLIWGKVLVHLVVLFVASMVCHGELANRRPSTRYLTEFYLLMSVGGVLGGLFNALTAPVIFHGLYEYPLALVIASLLTPPLEDEKPTRLGLALGTGMMGLFLGGALVLFSAALGRSDLEPAGLFGTDGMFMAAAVAAAALLALCGRRDANDDLSARWLDLGLPLALGLLAAGLNLGLRVSDVHRGLTWSYGAFLRASSDWMPPRLEALLNVSSGALLTFLIYVVPAVLCYGFVKRPVRFGLGVGALFLASAFCELLDEDMLLRERSFFGAMQVRDHRSYRRLEHGTTLHGMQRRGWTRAEVGVGTAAMFAGRDPLGTAAYLTAGQELWNNAGREPLTYFHRTGPIGQVFMAYQDWLKDRHTAIIGLGTGTMAAYGQPGQKITYYEIDPLVKRIAYNRKYFTYIQDALDRGVQLDLVMGDARLKLEERASDANRERFALLVIDAFSSDAIPVHLLTKEALAIYLDNVAEEGLIVIHISNRYLDLEPVLGNLAEALEPRLSAFIQTDSDADLPGKASSNWVILTRREANLNRLAHAGQWKAWKESRHWDEWQEAALRLTAVPDLTGRANLHNLAVHTLLDRLKAPWRKARTDPKVGVWSDDYSNLLSIFDWKH